MLLDILNHRLVVFRWRHIACLQTEGRHLLVGLCAFDFCFFQMGGVTTDLDGSSRLREYRQFGEVGEYDDKGCRFVECHLVVELSSGQTNRVQLMCTAHVIDIQLSLVHTTEAALYLELSFVAATT